MKCFIHWSAGLNSEAAPERVRRRRNPFKCPAEVSGPALDICPQNTGGLLLAVILFIDVGGVYWLINALHRSFEVFPLYANAIPMDQIVNKEYLVTLTSNVLYVGLQIASPVLLATLGQDLILGIISKTAPQVNVFQLSFLFKPVLGAAILLWIMPIIVNVINDYFISFAKIF